MMPLTRFLKGTLGRELILQRGGALHLEVYADADYKGSHVDHCSMMGYCTFVGDNLLTWWSKKQEVNACSSTEAEF